MTIILKVKEYENFYNLTSNRKKMEEVLCNQFPFLILIHHPFSKKEYEYIIHLKKERKKQESLILAMNKLLFSARFETKNLGVGGTASLCIHSIVFSLPIGQSKGQCALSVTNTK